MTAAPIRVRRAGPADTMALDTMMAAFLGCSEDQWRARGNALDAVLSSPSHPVFVAALASAPVGFVTASMRTVARYANPIVEIDELFVDAGHRRQGIARSLVDAVRAAGRAAGCGRLFVASNNARPLAHACYERLAFQPYGVHFRVDL